MAVDIKSDLKSGARVSFARALQSVFSLSVLFLVGCNAGLTEVPDDGADALSSNGSRYSVVGEASWYGPGFYGNRTANGEVLRPGAVTAAHRTLPFNTRVCVENLNSRNLKAVVRINDRGPFHGGRIIDLSDGAKEAIGMGDIGRVRVTVLRSGETCDDLNAAAVAAKRELLNRCYREGLKYEVAAATEGTQVTVTVPRNCVGYGALPGTKIVPRFADKTKGAEGVLKGVNSASQVLSTTLVVESRYDSVQLVVQRNSEEFYVSEKVALVPKSSAPAQVEPSVEQRADDEAQESVRQTRPQVSSPMVTQSENARDTVSLSD